MLAARTLKNRPAFLKIPSLALPLLPLSHQRLASNTNNSPALNALERLDRYSFAHGANMRHLIPLKVDYICPLELESVAVPLPILEILDDFLGLLPHERIQLLTSYQKPIILLC